MFACVCVCLHMCAWVCMYVHACVSECVCVCMHVLACMCAYCQILIFQLSNFFFQGRTVLAIHAKELARASVLLFIVIIKNGWRLLLA